MMGGRGMLSNVARYGDEFESLDTFMTSRGEVKVLKSKLSAENKAVLFTKTPGRIYATINSSGHVTSIYFFNSLGAISETWHIGGKGYGHRHMGSGHHSHPGPRHTKQFRRLSKAEKQYAREVDRRWRRRKPGRDWLNSRTR